MKTKLAIRYKINSIALVLGIAISGVCHSANSIPSHDPIYDEIIAMLCDAKILTGWECERTNQEVSEKYTIGDRSIYHRAKYNQMRLSDDKGNYLNIDTSFSKRGSYYAMNVVMDSNGFRDQTTVVFSDPQRDFYVPKSVLNEIDTFLSGNSGLQGPKYDSCVEFADSITPMPLITVFWSSNRIGCLIATGHWVEDD